MRIPLAVLLVTIALSGCFGGGDEEPPAPSTSTGSSTSTSNTTTSSTTTSSGPATSQEGTIDLNFTRATPNGAAPLTVEFLLDATFRSATGQVQTPPGNLSWSTTLMADDRSAGPNGTTLPARFNLTFTESGDVLVEAVVSAPGYAAANDTILVSVAPANADEEAPLFFDGAEGDDSQWTISSNVWIFEIFSGVEQETPVEHPEGTWTASEAQAHSGAKSWFSRYPDNYRTRMQALTVEVPAGGATLSYWVKGGAEANGADGLHVLINDAEAILHNNVPEWTMFQHDLPAGPAKILLRFDSDAGCSSDGPPDAAAGVLCGSGYDLGGIYVDDVTVTAGA